MLQLRVGKVSHSGDCKRDPPLAGVSTIWLLGIPQWPGIHWKTMYVPTFVINYNKNYFALNQSSVNKNIFVAHEVHTVSKIKSFHFFQRCSFSSMFIEVMEKFVMINKILVKMRDVGFELLYINNKNHKIKSVSGLKTPRLQVPTYKGTKWTIHCSLKHQHTSMTIFNHYYSKYVPTYASNTM
jgi:hypothetical protein